MIRCLTLIAVASIATNAIAGDSKAPAKSKDAKSIFNGKDLTGWSGDDRLWSVKDGVIRGETTKNIKANGNTFLIWDGKVKDFELHITFRVSTANNSGIQYRSKHITDKVRNKWVVRGYQHEIRNSNTLPSVAGFIYDEGGRRGRMALVGDKTAWSKPLMKKIATEKVIDGAGFKKLFKVDGWNNVVIVAKGHHLQHFMNGKLIMDCVDESDNFFPEGVLALQLHAGAPMWAEFKDISVREIK